MVLGLEVLFFPYLIMLLRLGVLSGSPPLSLFEMLLRLGVLSWSPPLSLFDMLLRLRVLSGGPSLSLFDMLLLARRGLGTWCSLCGSPSWVLFFVFLDVGPSILFIVFPLFCFWDAFVYLRLAGFHQSWVFCRIKNYDSNMSYVRLARLVSLI